MYTYTGMDTDRYFFCIFNRWKQLQNSEIHEIKVISTNNLSSLVYNEVEVIFSVIDTNDNPPLFDRANYQFQISENTLLGTIIGEIKATDLDGTSQG